MFEKRLLAVKKLLTKQKADAMLVSSIPNIIYLTGFSGFSHEEREAYLLITQKNNYIFTDARYSEAVVKQVPHFSLQEITHKLPLSALLKRLVKKENLKVLGIEESNITISESKTLYPCTSTWTNMSLDSLRIIKEKGEIEMIQKACDIGDRAFEYIQTQIKENISEKELALLLEMFIKKQNAELSFRTIAAFGAHSSVPHHQTNNKSRLTNNSIVLLDFGVKVGNYCSDMTRTVFFGKAPEEFKKMYEAVRIGQEKAIELLNECVIARSQSDKAIPSEIATLPSVARDDIRDLAGSDPVTGSDVDAAARDYIISAGYPSIPHSVGHGIGLEVHEEPRLSPNSNDELKPGMVFSIEPGIYIAGTGGIRIEDLVTVTKNGMIILTHAPKHLIEL